MKHGYGLTIPETLDDVIDRGRTALIVYDMQVGIVPQIPDGGEIVRRVSVLLAAARENGYPVIFTRHMSLPNTLAGVIQLRTAMAWQRVDTPEATRPAFLRGSPAFEIAPELTPGQDEAVFDKLAMSAFVGTPLEFALRDKGINSFLIAGIALEVGIEPTVRHAADLGFIHILVDDACGYRDVAAAERARAGIRFSGNGLITDLATARHLLSG
jgi:nicotinamidase-related amidase